MSGFNLQRLKVLIIDDNREMRDVVRTVLEGFGVRSFRSASDGGQGFDAVFEYSPDLVITDWRMAPMDGIAFARKIRSSPESPDPFLPIILLTAYTEKLRVFTARDAGINEILAKPVSAQAMYERILALVNAPRPFIRTSTFFGPDRRRRRSDDYKGPERRLEKFAGGERRTGA